MFLKHTIMKKNYKTFILALMALAGTSTLAYPRGYHSPYRYGYARPVVTRTFVYKPVKTTRIDNRFTKSDRLEMALTYLRNNATLSISKYSKITGLPKATAEAELDTFVASQHNPIVLVMDGKKKLYRISC